jgi:VWFA-related protein
MIRLTSLALVGALGAGAQLPQPVPTRGAEHLLIDVVAVDRKGMPVSDLRPGELEVWINGYRVPIETLSVVSPSADDGGGRSLVLILDDITLPPAGVPRAREAARQLVERMSPNDQMAIVRLNGSSMEATSERARLLRSIDEYNVRASGVVRLDVLSQQVLETITAVARQLAETSDRKKTIVAIGAPWLFDTPIPPPTVARDLRQEWTEAMRAMAVAHVNLYVIDPSGVGMSRTAGGSSGFAGETGGYAFTNTNDLKGAADRVMREAGSYYVIDVLDPPVGRKADLRDLDVRVLRRGVTIQARRAIPGAR